MNRREHAVLSLFYDEGHQELTSSFLAYRMRMRTGDATALLDGMVRDGILDLHVDTEGHLSYRLPEDERHRIDRHGHRPQTHHPHQGGASHYNVPPFGGARQPGGARQQPGNEAGPAGADATVGYGQPAPSGQVDLGQRSVHDGTDGSVHGFAPQSPVYGYGAPTAMREHASSQAADAWFQNEPEQTATADPLRTHPFPPHKMAPQGQMTPYHSQVPAYPPRHYPERIPILAGALSLIFPGLGQFYNGEFGKGILLLFSTAFLWVFFLFWIVWIWSVIDAYMVAEYRNQQALNGDQPSPTGLLPDQRNPGPNPNSHVA